MKPKRDILTLLLIVALPVPFALAQEEYSFDMSAYEKDPFEFSGYGELLWEHMQLEQEAAVYLVNFLDQDRLTRINRYTASAQLQGKYEYEQLKLFARLNPQAYEDELDDDAEMTVHEAYVSWEAKTGVNLDLGKKLIKWGKGYAWNPVGFIERPKDPNEPDLAREGFTFVSADWIISKPGDLQTIALSPVYLPVTDDINRDFGEEDDNFAGRIYFLYKDTDIDLMFLNQGSRSARYGVDFSRNLSSNFEIHGEWAYISDFPRKYLDKQAVLTTKTEDVQSWLLGFRYLTESDTTYIAEYYDNGTGLDEKSLRNYYQYVHDIPNQADPDAALIKARALGEAGFIRQSPARRYFYARITQKEPFDWLYVTPAITTMVNLQDQSYSLSPEVSYTAISNLELRLKLAMLQGSSLSEFGEKQNRRKLELRLRYFF